MNEIHKIKSFKQLATIKETYRVEAKLARKQLEIETLELRYELEPRRILSGAVNKLLESFFRKL